MMINLANKLKGLTHLGIAHGLAISGLFLLSSTSFAEQLMAKVTYPDKIHLSSPVSSTIKKAPELGQFYAQGQNVLSFDKSVLNAKQRFINSQYQMAKKSQAEGQRELDRASELFEGGMMADHEFKLAEIDYLKQKTAFAKANFKLVEVNWQAKHSSLKAPFDGYVIESKLYQGKAINNRLGSETLVGFVAKENLKFKLQLAKQVEAKFTQGARVSIAFANAKLTAKVLSQYVQMGNQYLVLEAENPKKQMPSEGAWLELSLN